MRQCGHHKLLAQYAEGGKLVFQVFASVAEFERDLIRERTMAGLEAARARGRKVGRKRAMDAKKMALASKLLLLQ